MGLVVGEKGGYKRFDKLIKMRWCFKKYAEKAFSAPDHLSPQALHNILETAERYLNERT